MLISTSLVTCTSRRAPGAVGRRDWPLRHRRLDAEPALLSRRSDRARAGIAGRLEGGALRPVADVRAGVQPVRQLQATSRAACARRTSTRSTRCRTRAGSPTASAPGRSRTKSSSAAPNVGAPPDPSKWVLIREKTSGAHPGFTAMDAKGETWFLEFDPPDFPEGATAAVAIATKIFWALGYNQVESFLTTFDPKNADDRSEGHDPPPERQANAVHAGRHQRHPRERRAQPGRHLSRHRRPPAAGQDSRRLPVRRHAPRRSQRSRAARAPARAAGAARLRRVDEPHRPQGREHARHADHRERQDDRQALPAGRRLHLRHVQRLPRVGPELRSTSSRVARRGSASSRSGSG